VLTVRATEDHIIELRLTPVADQGLVIGRTDKKRTVVPDIDLTPYGARDAGVSRQHAVLQLCNGAYTVEDLDSVNGTYLNHERVPPGQAITFQSGDELRLGRMRVRVEIAH
jgi:pSer/pThr/pTyr-binding forkhead associated (FHA) protein